MGCNFQVWLDCVGEQSSGRNEVEFEWNEAAGRAVLIVPRCRAGKDVTTATATFPTSCGRRQKATYFVRQVDVTDMHSSWAVGSQFHACIERKWCHGHLSACFSPRCPRLGHNNLLEISVLESWHVQFLKYTCTPVRPNRYYLVVPKRNRSSKLNRGHAQPHRSRSSSYGVCWWKHIKKFPASGSFLHVLEIKALNSSCLVS
jgi:hypothetical protein